MLTEKMTLLDMPDVNTFHTSLVVICNNTLYKHGGRNTLVSDHRCFYSI